MESSDRQLIRNIRKGDAKSFEELFDRYYDRFYAFACALLHDRDAAEDILQNVFLKLWIGRERLDEDRSVSNYLLVSVRNEIYDWLSLKYNSAVVRCSAPLKARIIPLTLRKVWRFWRLPAGLTGLSARCLPSVRGYS